MLSEHQSKTSPRASGHRSNLSQPLLFSHRHNSSQLLLLSSGKRGSPPSVRGRAHHPRPCTLRLQRPLWEDVNSAPSLPQKRVTRDLLDPWSRAWSPGSVREAEVKPCGAGAETSPRTEAGSLDPWSRAWITGAVRKPEVKVLLR